MGIFEKLFTKTNEIGSRDLKIALIGVKRERRRKQIELRKNDARSGEILKKMKRARREGNNADVSMLYDELTGLKAEASMTRRDIKILGLEHTGLSRYARGFERLEKTGNKSKIKDIITKITTSGLDEKLRGSELDEAAYTEMLQMHMEELGLEVDDIDAADNDSDNEAKKAFLKDLDMLIAAEEGGDFDKMEEEEAKLKQHMLESEKA